MAIYAQHNKSLHRLIQDGADVSEADNRLKLINLKRSAELLVSVKK